VVNSDSTGAFAALLLGAFVAIDVMLFSRFLLEL
jgi:hypothetical protein